MESPKLFHAPRSATSEGTQIIQSAFVRTGQLGRSRPSPHHTANTRFLHTSEAGRAVMLSQHQPNKKNHIYFQFSPTLLSAHILRARTCHECMEQDTHVRAHIDTTSCFSACATHDRSLLPQHGECTAVLRLFPLCLQGLTVPQQAL